MNITAAQLIELLKPYADAQVLVSVYDNSNSTYVLKSLVTFTISMRADGRVISVTLEAERA